MKPGFELFDHTADVGLRVWAPSPGELAYPAAQALYTAIGELVSAAAPQEYAGEWRNGDAAVLLRDFLADLLLRFERDAMMLTRVDACCLGDERLAVRGELRPVDPSRSVLQREVKAVTYHDLEIRQAGQGYEAIIIVDI